MAALSAAGVALIILKDGAIPGKIIAKSLMCVHWEVK
jgi:hypothetical protein